jgi:hypothetical protein
MAVGDGELWDETTPDDTTNLSDGDNHIVHVKKATRIRFDKEHVCPASQANTATAGYHRSITFQPAATSPSALVAGTTAGAMSMVTSGSGYEFIVCDSAKNNVQITFAGGLNAGAGKIASQTAGCVVLATSAAGLTITTSGASGQVLTRSGTSATWQSPAYIGSSGNIQFMICDGGDIAITTGEKGHLIIPFACTVSSYTCVADTSGTITVDIWKDSYANHPPADADSICATAQVTIATAVKGTDTTLTGWTKTITAGNILAFNVDTCTTIKRVTIALNYTGRTG